MSGDHSTTIGDGVAYWRMSSSPQEKSISQQRGEMLPRCKLAGLEIVREFKDEAVSGGGVTNRDGFLDALGFCQQRYKQGSPIAALVCYETSRFSRATSIETAHYMWEFQRVGVHRVFTCERWWDFRNEEDRAIFLLQQDFTNNRYLRDLSRRVLRGKKDVAAAGYFTGGMVPYGFDRLVLDRQDAVQARVRRGEPIGLRPKGWHVVLAPIPEDDPDPARQLERQTAIWLFTTFDAEEVSRRELARKLNDRGVPGPGSHYHRRDKGDLFFKWTVPAVTGILANPVYWGEQEIGEVAKGKYHRLISGEVKAVSQGERPNYHAAPADMIRSHLEHGGLVSVELGRRVQQKLQDRAREKTFPRSNGYALSGGILHCGHCGGRMYGATCRPKRGAKVYVYRTYRCGTNATKPGSCGSYSVREEIILDRLKDELLNVYLDEERLAGLEQKLFSKTRAKHAGASDQVGRLQKRLTALDAEVRQAAQNVLRCKDNVDVLNDQLSALRKTRDEIAGELAKAEEVQATPVVEALAVARKAFARLRDLREQLRQANPKSVARVLRLLVSRVDVYFKPVEKGKRRLYVFAKGVMKLRPVIDVQGSDKHLR